MTGETKVFGLVGGLVAFPRRLAAREVERQHGELQRGVTRRTSHVVFGRKLLAKSDSAGIEAGFARELAAGRAILSENGFLGILGLRSVPADSSLSRQSVLDQSKLDAHVFDMLALFDAFEHGSEPFSFRDLILARKYAGLLAGGTTWLPIARSVHRSGPVASLTALSLQVERGNTIYARSGELLSELDGQVLLPLDRDDDDDELDELFAKAEAAEDAGDHLAAADFYRRCLSIDPTDAVTLFNRGNCLREAKLRDEAHQAYLAAIKRDPRFAEAWFNLADLLAKEGNVDGARRHFLKAIALDGGYADPVFNLANLEFEAGNLGEARTWWSRYLELDDASEWARAAARGIQYADLQLTQKTAG